MDSNPYMNLNFVDLLQSQQDFGVGSESSPIPLFGTQATESSNFEPDSPVETRGKKPIVEGKDVGELQKMLVTKEKMSKMKLLDRLMAKQEPLDDDEVALKKKLINELLLSN
ncbi:hypothetical protein Bca52824_055427 [Brassica carinata]|uniref:Uncharacterized protein n=1 Tax=Brassica carinata TaxID=52824 RepID=A0A8X7UML0_BRACI|nr:hypothetical protein Bca52824_055427 [Brassica carinata]